MKFADVYSKIPDAERIMHIGALRERYNFYGIEDTAEVSDYIYNPDDFFFLTSFVSAQSKAPSIDKFIARVIGGEIISPSEERGDVHIIDPIFFSADDYVELKTSTTNESHNLNARQIRLWQNVDYYILSYINELDLGNSIVYLIPHDDMTNLCSLFGSSTHGTVNIADQNAYNEISITIPVYNTNSDVTTAFLPYRNDTLRDWIVGYGE